MFTSDQDPYQSCRAKARTREAAESTESKPSKAGKATADTDASTETTNTKTAQATSKGRDAILRYRQATIPDIYTETTYDAENSNAGQTTLCSNAAYSAAKDAPNTDLSAVSSSSS